MISEYPAGAMRGVGGFGSGRQGRRPTVEEGFSLDINGLLRDRGITPGGWRWGTLRWTVVGTGREVSSLSYEANLADPDAAWLRLRYTMGDGEARQTFDYKVYLTTTRPPRGGVRWWFLCPSSGRRCAKLHRPPGGDLFAARQTWRLGYHSQRVAPLERRRQAAEGRALQLRRRLGGAASRRLYYEGVPPRPKGMHRKTYRRLRREMEKAEREVERWLWAGVVAIVESTDRAACRRG
jgi:hypothetical protein